jgi:hypothetical protein
MAEQGPTERVLALPGGRTTYTYRSGSKRTFTHVRAFVINYSTGPEPAWTPTTPDGREVYIYPMEPWVLGEQNAEAIYEAVGMTPWWQEASRG